MSDEYLTPPRAVLLLQQEQIKLKRRYLNALEVRADAQCDVEANHRGVEEFDESIEEMGVQSDVDAGRLDKLCENRILEHAVKFADLTAPATILPERAITLTIRHPDVHNGPFNAKFASLLRDALVEFSEYQLDVENRMPSNPPPEPRYPFKASNGCVVEVLPHVQVNAPE